MIFILIESVLSMCI